MREFFLSTHISKRLGSTENEITAQLETLELMVKEISVIDPVFANWYVNNADEDTTEAPLDYPFPSEKAHKYLFNLRNLDNFESFSLWNGLEESSQFVSLRYDSFDLMMIFKKVFNTDQVIQLFQVLLKYAHYNYVYLNTYFFGDINVFPHRAETTAICYVPVEIADDYLPHLYKKVDVDNQYNKGTILVFDEKWADETDELKKIVQENSIALVELGVIPETELPDGFFNE
ncbi:TPA: hypothetical protein ACGDVI_000005 [Acinetobacter baumannii]|uniref:hypothetical protein n=1 Tax=Acinetobacter baumannii TaxID=470 RepID=UPI000F746F6C|nr:hypothetical protein [Acinetobacter baumannii]MDO7200755.1 hypothetical protein [Acinetobacter baumannii]RSP97612.1 hypothetical protein EA716_02155 [Acinetobacter baumannii]HEE5793703.1 hypothetical protein [Acinetobacter baumannii]